MPVLAVRFPNTHCRLLTGLLLPCPSVCSGFLPVYPILESPTARKGVESVQRQREDDEEGLSPVGLGPKGEKRKWVGLLGRERVGETRGDNMSWVREQVQRWEVKRGRECTLDSLRNLEVPSGVRGPKDRAPRPLTQIPLLANIPVLQIYWLLRNNNCLRPEAEAASFPLSTGDWRLEMSPNTDVQDVVSHLWV